MQYKNKRKMISLRLGEGHIEYLKNEADKRGITQTKVIEEALDLEKTEAQRNPLLKLKGLSQHTYGENTHEIDEYLRKERSSWK